MAKVAINGLGRIGRATFKMVMATPELDLVAVNDIADGDNLAYLIQYDTVYGKYEHAVSFDDGKLIVDGTEIPYLSERDPSQLPWDKNDIDIVFECTGLFTSSETAGKHIEAGAKYVIVSGPTKSPDMPTLVHGVNRTEEEVQVVSCASCTTNNVGPVIEVMDRHFGVEKAIMTTIHAYTATQAIVDAPAKKDYRRGRAAAANFVPTSTGAAVAATKAYPEMEGKFDGVAVRAPIPVGSISDIVLVISKDATVDEINAAFKTESEGDRYKNILGYTEEPIVSSDIVKSPLASLVDGGMTKVVDGNLVKVMSWYDNEWGYTNQMIRKAVNLVNESSKITA